MERKTKTMIAMSVLVVMLLMGIASAFYFETQMEKINILGIELSPSWLIRVEPVSNATLGTASVTPTLNTKQLDRNSNGKFEISFSNINLTPSMFDAQGKLDLAYSYRITNDGDLPARIVINDGWANTTGITGTTRTATANGAREMVEDIHIRNGVTTLWRYQMVRNTQTRDILNSSIVNTGNTFTLDPGASVVINLNVVLGVNTDEWFGNAIDINIEMPFTATQVQ